MNIRRQNYKLYRTHGLSAYRSAILAGYTHATSWNAHKNIEKHCNFTELMVKEGLDDQSLMEVIKAGTMVRSSSSGQPTLVTKTFVELACKLSGRLKEKDININNNTKVNVYPTKTIVFTGIDDIDRETQIQDVYATKGEDSARFEGDASSS